MRDRIFATLVAASALLIGGVACERREPPPVGAPPAAEPAPQPVVGAEGDSADCDDLPSADELRRFLREAPERGEAGGMAGGRKEWAALVNRAGEICEVVVSTDDPAAAWPGSRQVAMAKAYTANAFSTDDAPLSTARLYTLTQPGHSLWGLAAANPFRADCFAAPDDRDDSDGKICGGTIAFGGGVPLYRGGKRIGGLGASGDTACADHEIAKRIRDAAGLNPPGGASADDITYGQPDEPGGFTHPLCKNTWRNGQQLGDERPAAGY